MGREFELKYAATAQLHKAIFASFGPFRKISMETTYYDTVDGALAALKITLRLRRENETLVCTLKMPLPQGGQQEWECEAENLADGLRHLAMEGAPKLVAEDLLPVCGARFTRMAALLPTADGTAELALDQGVLLSGGREMPLCELEVEKKSGSDEATVALANEIASAYDLQPEPRSKFRRALGLAKGE